MAAFMKGEKLYYEDDFYYEPTELEEKVEEFKESLRKSVKQDIQEELERLRTENEALYEFKEQKENYEREHNNAMRNLEYEKENFKREVKRMRLTELLGDLSFNMWFANSKRVEPPKCDACDNRRMIHYKTPSGKDASEECPTCGKSTYFYEPEEIEAYEFSQNKNRYGDEYPHISLYFNRKVERDYDSFERCRTLYNGEPFEKAGWKPTFLDKETCQEYCDWKNAQSQVSN